VLDSVRDEFADGNVPLHLVLGLISLARRLDASLPAPPEVRAEVDAAPSPPAPPAPSEAFLYLVLGLVSLRRTLARELDPIRAAHEARRAGSSASRPSPAPNLRLRDLLR
jgi:hypothetical protein